MEQDINQRVLRLKDVALGSTRNVTVNSALATASYDCAVDSLLALYAECSQSSLAKDKHVGRFLSKCECFRCLECYSRPRYPQLCEGRRECSTILLLWYLSVF